MRRAVLTVSLFVWVACEGHEFHPPSAEARRVEAESAFAQTRFDTVQWANAETRASEGNEVFAAHCRRCHGTLGRGDGELARAQKLAVPSLVEPNWRYAAADSIRHRVFIGHYPEMRTWGIAGLTQRDIDAVAHYIAERLRPEVLR